MKRVFEISFHSWILIHCPERLENKLKIIFCNYASCMLSSIASYWIPVNVGKYSQYWFSTWFAAVRQQAISWANVDPYIPRHMASLGHNYLIYCRLLKFTVKKYTNFTRSSLLSMAIHVPCLMAWVLVNVNTVFRETVLSLQWEFTFWVCIFLL